MQNGTPAGAITSTGGFINGIGGPASLTTTAGTKTLTRTNTYTGITTLDAGPLLAGATNIVFAGEEVNIASGAT